MLCDGVAFFSLKDNRNQAQVDELKRKVVKSKDHEIVREAGVVAEVLVESVKIVVNGPGIRMFDQQDGVEVVAGKRTKYKSKHDVEDVLAEAIAEDVLVEASERDGNADVVVVIIRKVMPIVILEIVLEDVLREACVVNVCLNMSVVEEDKPMAYFRNNW